MIGNRSRIVLDIETIACCPTPILEAKISEAQQKVTREKPKSNNPKEETLRRIENEYRQKLVIAREKVLDSLPLSPLTGRVLCVGIGVRNSSGDWAFSCHIAKTDDEEALMLERVMNHVSEAGSPTLDPVFITYNGRAFDFPFIVARCMVRNVKGYRFPLGYQSSAHIDLYKALGEGKLNEWSMVILRDMKTGTGKEVADWAQQEEWDRIHEYSIQDLSLLARIYDRFEDVATFR